MGAGPARTWQGRRPAPSPASWPRHFYGYIKWGLSQGKGSLVFGLARSRCFVCLSVYGHQVAFFLHIINLFYYPLSGLCIVIFMEEQKQHSKTSYGIGDGTEPTVAEEDRSLSATHTHIGTCIPYIAYVCLGLNVHIHISHESKSKTP